MALKEQGSKSGSRIGCLNGNLMPSQRDNIDKSIGVYDYDDISSGELFWKKRTVQIEKFPK